MTKILDFVKSFAHDESGATAVEYGLMVALIAVVIIVAVALLGKELNDIFNTVQNCIKNAGATGC
jgi:pilus assembly protein Flp/PilA